MQQFNTKISSVSAGSLELPPDIQGGYSGREGEEARERELMKREWERLPGRKKVRERGRGRGRERERERERGQDGKVEGEGEGAEGKGEGARTGWEEAPWAPGRQREGDGGGLLASFSRDGLRPIRRTRRQWH